MGGVNRSGSRVNMASRMHRQRFDFHTVQCRLLEQRDRIERLRRRLVVTPENNLKSQFPAIRACGSECLIELKTNRKIAARGGKWLLVGVFAGRRVLAGR